MQRETPRESSFQSAVVKNWVEFWIADEGDWLEMARKKFYYEKKTSRVIWSDCETVTNPLPVYD
jgi:hypothetical protein